MTDIQKAMADLWEKLKNDPPPDFVTIPVNTDAVAEFIGCSVEEAEKMLWDLVGRGIVEPDEGEE